MLAEDWHSVMEIYREGIATGNATFETGAPSWNDWDAHHLPVCRLVTTDGTAQVNGWAALTQYSSRKVYAGVAQVSIYIRTSFRGKGIGKLLLNEVIRSSEVAGIWTLEAGIFPENTASQALHQACGFRLVGRRERIGQLKGVWRDVLLFERRSDRVG